MAEIATLSELLNEIQQEGDLEDLVNNPSAQFGTPDDPYVGSTLLPEQNRDENMYKEDQIKYRSFIANAGSYYSPAQLNSAGELVGSFNVELGKTDQADQITAQDYNNLMKLLNRKAGREALMAAMRWFDNHILKPHLDLNEKYRWDSLIDAQVIRTGSNGFAETVDYPNPEGHRPAAIPGGTVANPAGWYATGTSYDPFEDIYAMVDLLSKKGYKVNRIFTGGRKLISVLGVNPTVRERTSRITVSSSGQIEAMPGRATAAQINAFLSEDEIPPIEIYRKTYHTRSGEHLFVPDNKLVFVCSTGRTEPVDLGDRGVLELANTLGYFGIGTPAGRFQPGRVTNVKEQDLYPGGFYAEGIQMGLPVNLNPEAVAVLEIGAPT